MVQFQLDFATIASALSIVLMIATLIGLAVKAGQRQEAIIQMKKDIDHMREKLSAYDTQAREDGRLMAGIGATLQSLVKSVDDLRLTILQHIGAPQ